MRKILYAVTTMFGFLCFSTDSFAQSGGGSTPDTALNEAVYFVHVAKRPNPNLETYMAIITAPENSSERGSHITFYRIACSTCNIIKWTPPAKETVSNPTFPIRYVSKRVISTVSGASEPVTDAALKRQLLRALMAQIASATRLLEAEIGE